MKIRPLQDRILVRRDFEKVSSGGIIIPDSAQNEKAVWTGTVVAVGPGKRYEQHDHTVRRSVDVRVGDTVLYQKYAGELVMVGREEHSMLREGDILGVIEHAPG